MAQIFKRRSPLIRFQIKRAKAVIVKYPDTIWIKDALDILLLSYQKLDLKTLAADTQKVIDFNDFSGKNTTVDPDDFAAEPEVAPPDTEVLNGTI